MVGQGGGEEDEDRMIGKCSGHCTFHLRFLSSSLYCAQSSISLTLFTTARGGSFSQGSSLTPTQGPSPDEVELSQNMRLGPR